MRIDPITNLFSRLNTNYFFGQPADTITFWFLLSIFSVFLVYVMAFYIFFRRKAKKEKPYKSYAKTFFWFNFTMTISVFIHLFARYESLPVLSWRFWMYLATAMLIAFNAWFFVKRKQQLEDDLAKFATAIRKAKWLPSKKKRK